MLSTQDRRDDKVYKLLTLRNLDREGGQQVAIRKEKAKSDPCYGFWLLPDNSTVRTYEGHIYEAYLAFKSPELETIISRGEEEEIYKEVFGRAFEAGWVRADTEESSDRLYLEFITISKSQVDFLLNKCAVEGRKLYDYLTREIVDLSRIYIAK